MILKAREKRFIFRLSLIFLTAIICIPTCTDPGTDFQDGPLVEISEDYFSASVKCRYKDVNACPSDPVGLTSFLTITYWPDVILESGNGIKVQLGNLLNDRVDIIEDRNWPVTRLFPIPDPPQAAETRVEVTIYYEDGSSETCPYKGIVGLDEAEDCDVEGEDCGNDDFCFYFCMDKDCLRNLQAEPSTSCNRIKVFLQNLPFDNPVERIEIVIPYTNTDFSSDKCLRVPNLPLSQSVLLAEKAGSVSSYEWLHEKYPELKDPYPVLEVGGGDITCFEVIVPTIPIGRELMVEETLARGGTQAMYEISIPVTVKAMQETAYPIPLERDSLKNAYLAENYQGTIWLYHNNAYFGEYTFQIEEQGKKEIFINLMASSMPTSVHRFTVYEVVGGQQTGIQGTSNPMVFQNTGAGRIYWGVLQSHSMQGGHANQNPAYCYEFARNMAKLDFYALSEHCNTAYFNWTDTKDLCDDFNRDSRFVTFPAFEWTSSTFGHRHVIFKSGADALDPIPCEEVREGSVGVYSRPDLEDFILDLHYDPAVPSGPPDNIIIPHHTCRMLDELIFEGGADGSGGPDLDLNEVNSGNDDPGRDYEDYIWGGPEASTTYTQTMVEIFGTHGRCDHYIPPGQEYIMENNEDMQLPPDSRGFVDWALKEGFYFGFVSGSDNHAGTSGSLFGGSLPVPPQSPISFYSRSGLTAVKAASLTRASIWQALKARKTYSTTGARIYLDVRIGYTHGQSGERYSIHEIGENFELPDGWIDPEIHVTAVGTYSVAQVQLVIVSITDQTVQEVSLPFTQTGDYLIQASKNLLEYLDPGKKYCFYIRIKQDNENSSHEGHLAWSSPIWMAVPSLWDFEQIK